MFFCCPQNYSNSRFRIDLPEGRQIKVHNKSFYFDIGQNNRGVYMRISEVKILKMFDVYATVRYNINKMWPCDSHQFVLIQVKGNFRTAITVPENCWSRFRDILTDYCDKMKRSPGPASSLDNTLHSSLNNK